MGIIANSNGNIYSSYSGFKGINSYDATTITGMDFPSSNYYNVYKTNYGLNTHIWHDYSQGMLGDATKEVNIPKSNLSNLLAETWYNDYSNFPTVLYPWFNRGGLGIFGFSNRNGIDKDDSTRSVLAF